MNLRERLNSLDKRLSDAEAKLRKLTNEKTATVATNTEPKTAKTTKTKGASNNGKR